MGNLQTMDNNEFAELNEVNLENFEELEEIITPAIFGVIGCCVDFSW